MHNGQQLCHFFQFTALKHCAKFQEKITDSREKAATIRQKGPKEA